eukprot:14380701-Alexandrium_andersonii.AAC.1
MPVHARHRLACCHDNRNGAPPPGVRQSLDSRMTYQLCRNLSYCALPDMEAAVLRTPFQEVRRTAHLRACQ